jgi:hypothetical protein
VIASRDLDQSRLATAVLSRQDVDTAGPDLQTDVIDSLLAPKGLRQRAAGRGAPAGSGGNSGRRVSNPLSASPGARSRTFEAGRHQGTPGTQMRAA